MSIWLLLTVFVIYAAVGVGKLLEGNWPWAVVWTGYAFAQLGLIAAMTGSRV